MACVSHGLVAGYCSVLVAGLLSTAVFTQDLALFFCSTALEKQLMNLSISVFPILSAFIAKIKDLQDELAICGKRPSLHRIWLRDSVKTSREI